MTTEILQLALTALPDGQDLPTELPLFRFGENRTRKGTFVFDQDSAASVMAAYAEHGIADIPFDWDHAMLNPNAKDPRAAGEAAGWFRPEIRIDGLWAANIRFTDDAAAAIKAKKWRFYSPAALRTGNKITRLINVALTNLPATDGQQPLISKESAEPTYEQSAEQSPSGVIPKKGNVMKDALVLALGLKEGSDESVVLSEVGKLRAAHASILELTGKGTVEEAKGTIQAWKASAEEYAKASVELSEIKARAKADARTVLLSQHSRKFTPNELEGWVKEASYEFLSSYVQSAPDRVPAESAAPVEPAVDRIVLSADERAIAKQLGLTDKQFAESRANLEKGGAQ